MQKLYTGTLIGIEPRQNDWHRFHIVVPGLNYPVKLETKRPELIQTGNTLVGQQVSALADETESGNINPNSGKPYINRTLQNIAPAGSLPQPAPQPQFAPTSGFTPQPTFPVPGHTVTPPPVLPPMQPMPSQQPAAFPFKSGGMDEETIRRITWLSACSTAANLMQNMLQSGADPQAIKQAGPSLFAIADAIYSRARQVERGQLEQRAEVAQQMQQEPVYQDPGNVEQPPPHGDDDVPF